MPSAVSWQRKSIFWSSATTSCAVTRCRTAQRRRREPNIWHNFNSTEMNWSEIELQPDDRKLRQFEAIGASVLAAVSIWRGLHAGGWIVIAVVAALIAALGIIRPR